VVARSGSDVASFSSTSDSSEFIIEPVARSFHRRHWQQVRGPYTKRVKITSRSKVQCSLKIPIRRNGDSYKYVLMTTGHSLKNIREKRSRFLSQTTFGPKLSEIDGWSHGTGVKGYADYIEAQMTLPPTFHRAYWRERIDYSLVMEHSRHSTQVPNHPCNKYSRWRDYTFTGSDYGKDFKVEAIEVAGRNETMLMISVLDPESRYYEPRTVVEVFEAYKDFNHGWECDTEAKSIYCGVGEYQTCKLLLLLLLLLSMRTSLAHCICSTI